MGKIIAVVSGKGGTGKTTAVGAISSCLGAMGARTLCVDCDADLKNLDITLGLTNYLCPDISAVVNGECGLEEAVILHPELENLWFLPSMDFNRPEMTDDVLSSLFDVIRNTFDFCLLDAPAGIGEDVRTLVRYADCVIIAATGDLSSLRDAQVMCASLQQLTGCEIRLLVNRVSPPALRQAGLNIDDMIDRVGARLLGIIREDRAVPFSANRETPLVLYSRGRAARGFLRAARRLNGENIPIREN